MEVIIILIALCAAILALVASQFLALAKVLLLGVLAWYAWKWMDDMLEAAKAISSELRKTNERHERVDKATEVGSIKKTLNG